MTTKIYQAPESVVLCMVTTSFCAGSENKMGGTINGSDNGSNEGIGYGGTDDDPNVPVDAKAMKGMHLWEEE